VNRFRRALLVGIVGTIAFLVFLTTTDTATASQANQDTRTAAVTNSAPAATPTPLNIPIFLYNGHPDWNANVRPCKPNNPTDASDTARLVKDNAPKLSPSVATTYSAPQPPASAPGDYQPAIDAVANDTVTASPVAIVAFYCRADYQAPSTNGQPPQIVDELTADITAVVFVRDQKTRKVLSTKWTHQPLSGSVFTPPTGKTSPAGNPLSLQPDLWSALYPPSIPIYLLSTSTFSNTACAQPTDSDIKAVHDMITNQAPDLGGVYRWPAPVPDPIADVKTTAKIIPAPANAVIAAVCRTGNVVNATITGYVLRRDQTGKVTQIVSGKALSATIDALEGSDWSQLYVSPTYSGVGYLPVSGDNADTVNNYLEHAVPFPITAITDVKTATALCVNTSTSMLIVGQGSLATQTLDPFRLIFGAVGFSLKSPTPWLPAEQFGLAALGLALVPAKQNIAVDIFDCYDGSIRRLVDHPIYKDDGTLDDKEMGLLEPTLHIIGHSRRYGWGTSDPAAARSVLDNAVSDLEWQVSCIVITRINSSETSAIRQANDPDALPKNQISDDPKCIEYYRHLTWNQVWGPILSPVFNHKRLYGPASTSHPVTRSSP
jgi:hypothetical protein